MTELRAFSSLLQLAGRIVWLVPAIVGLGALSALLEGLGIYLFIPLLESLLGNLDRDWADNPLLELIDGLLDVVPADARTQAILGAIVGIIVVKNLVAYANNLLWTWFEAKMNTRLQDRLFQRLTDLRHEEFDRRSAGGDLNTFESQAWNATDALSSLAASVIDAIAVVILIGLLLLLSWQLTLIVLIAVAAIAVVVHLVTRRTERLGRELVDAEARLSVRLWDALMGWRTIKAFGREAYERQRYAAATRAAIEVGFRQEAIASIAWPLAEILAVLLLGAIVLATVAGDPALLPATITFIVILHRLLPRAQSLMAARVKLISELGAIENVMAWLETGHPPPPPAAGVPFAGLEDAIMVEGVSHRYPGTRTPALDRVSLRIARGRTTALVGPSGAGKSTLIGLLCRLYDVTDGRITVDGTALEALDLAHWRARTALVAQNIHLFNGSIRDNIAYGRLDASDDEIVAAAIDAVAHDFILVQPEGYATLVGDAGLRLSGGQRQRIALARALVARPDILILDEATNALDALAEDLVQDALDRFAGERTIIVVAHRLSTIRRADHIVVLQAGRVVEQGDLATLSANGATFRSVCRP